MTDIITDRLVLRMMPRAALKATINRDLRQITSILQLDMPETWLDMAWLAQMRLNQMIESPEYEPWSIRAIGLHNQRLAVGFINCHSIPDCGRIELGYEIFPEFQRQGYAFEAICGFLQWAKQKGVTEAVFSISPNNRASLELNRKLGTVRIGSHIDEKDGLEEVFLLRL